MSGRPVESWATIGARLASVAYTAHEWASQSDADWEVSDEGDWLYRGEQYPGAWEVTEL